MAWSDKNEYGDCKPRPLLRRLLHAVRRSCAFRSARTARSRCTAWRGSCALVRSSGLSMTNTLASAPTSSMAAHPAPQPHRGPAAELPPGPEEAHQVPGTKGLAGEERKLHTWPSQCWGGKETAHLAKPMTRGMDLQDKEQAQLPLYPPPLLPPRPC